MKRTAASLIALAVALSAGSAIAAEQVIVNNATGEGLFGPATAVASKSRDQVRSELAEAVRSGAVIANNATGETVRTAGRSPFAAGFEARVTRDQVKAELAEAARNGELIANNATGETFGQGHPNRHVRATSPADAS